MSKVIIEDWPVTDLFDESQCTTDSPAFSGIVPGSTDSICIDSDNTYTTVDFMPPSFDAAGDQCTDLAPVWSYSVDQSSLTTQQKESVKISIDSTKNQISVKALTDA